MRHGVKKGRKLSRSLGQRNSLVRNLLTSLVEADHLKTTLAKAKEVKREFDILVNRAKRANLSGNFSLKRKIFKYLTKKSAALKLFEEVLPRLQERSSGYLSLVREPGWRSDGATAASLKILKSERAKNEKDKNDEIKSGPGAPKAVASTGRRNGASRSSRRKNS